METLTPNSYILITGGSGGIGRALAKSLSNKNVLPIIGFNKNSEKANNLAKELNTFAVKIDMNSKKSINDCIEIINSKMGNNNNFIGVVLCASPSPDILPFLDTEAEHLSKQFQVNVIGHQLLLKAIIKNFFKKKKKGTIIGVLSKAIGSENEQTATNMCSYIIAKSALKSMLSVCAAEFNWLSVRTVTPSFTKTKMLNVFDSRYIEILDKQKKISTPEEVAELIIDKINL